MKPQATILTVMLALAGVLTIQTPAHAGKTKAIREVAEYVVERFGKEAAEETAESIAAKLTRLSARHGDEAIDAVRAMGPRAFTLIDDAGEHAPTAIRLIARHGDEAAWVIAEPRRLALVTRYGDDAAEAMIKHKDIVLPLLEQAPDAAAKAFKAVSGQSARRLAMLDDAGDLARIGQTDKLLGVVGRYGDKAADFIWRNKAALATAAALTAFLANPEPFIEGTKDLAQIAGAVAAEPLRQAAIATDWTRVSLTAMAIAATLIAIRWRRFWLNRSSTAR